MDRNKLMRQQLDQKIANFIELKAFTPPSSGWVQAVRKALNMSLRQLSARLSITPQSVRELEIREKNGTITLNRLRQLGEALDMKLVYGFIPASETLENMIESRATELAREIVLRTSTTMDLEEQKNSDERIKQAIREKALEIKIKMPRYLWD